MNFQLCLLWLLVAKPRNKKKPKKQPTHVWKFPLMNSRLLDCKTICFLPSHVVNNWAQLYEGQQNIIVTCVSTPPNLLVYWSTLEKLTRFNARLYRHLYLCKNEQYYPDHIGQTGYIDGPSSLFLKNLMIKSQWMTKHTTRAFIFWPGR